MGIVEQSPVRPLRLLREAFAQPERKGNADQADQQVQRGNQSKSSHEKRLPANTRRAISKQAKDCGQKISLLEINVAVPQPRLCSAI
jgi:hypothetical protein